MLLLSTLLLTLLSLVWATTTEASTTYAYTTLNSNTGDSICWVYSPVTSNAYDVCCLQLSPTAFTNEVNPQSTQISNAGVLYGCAAYTTTGVFPNVPLSLSTIQLVQTFPAWPSSTSCLAKSLSAITFWYNCDEELINFVSATITVGTITKSPTCAPSPVAFGQWTTQEDIFGALNSNGILLNLTIAGVQKHNVCGSLPTLATASPLPANWTSLTPTWSPTSSLSLTPSPGTYNVCDGGCVAGIVVGSFIAVAVVGVVLYASFLLSRREFQVGQSAHQTKQDPPPRSFVSATQTTTTTTSKPEALTTV